MSDPDPLSPDEIAERVGRTMFAADGCSQALGMQIEAVTPGYARLSMTVRDDMLNAHKTCHGGMLFTLADSTFGYCCNAANKAAVAQTCEIVFLRPGKLGDRLTAECTERAVEGRSGVYDVTITNQSGDIIAMFRGKSRLIPGDVVPGLTPGVSRDEPSKQE